MGDSGGILFLYLDFFQPVIDVPCSMNKKVEIKVEKEIVELKVKNV